MNTAAGFAALAFGIYCFTFICSLAAHAINDEHRDLGSVARYAAYCWLAIVACIVSALVVIFGIVTIGGGS